MNASIGPGWTPIRPASQPRSKIAWTTPQGCGDREQVHQRCLQRDQQGAEDDEQQQR
jgi:hypothetical protein